jgi:hypothetical protein
MYYPNVILVREGVTNHITRTTLTMRVYWIIETKYRESQTVAIPPFIRTGAKYKSLLYQKFSALFEEFKTPELFGTFTCDDRSDGQVAVAEHFGGPGAKTHKDPVLFTMHWKRQCRDVGLNNIMLSVNDMFYYFYIQWVGATNYQKKGKDLGSYRRGTLGAQDPSGSAKGTRKKEIQIKKK